MARPKSDEKRKALLRAATRVIDAHGLGAPTALIAKEAGVANGTLFTYFPTKVDLLNELYLDLKGEMADAAQSGLSEDGEPRERLLVVWTNWTRWAVANPEARRALAQLATAEEIASVTREEANLGMAKVGALIERARAEGPMREASMAFVARITDAIASATMDHMVQDAAHADAHGRAGFDALWRVVSGG